MNIIDEIYNLDDKIIELESKRQDLLNNKEIYFISIKRKDLSPLSKIFKRILKIKEKLLILNYSENIVIYL